MFNERVARKQKVQFNCNITSITFDQIFHSLTKIEGKKIDGEFVEQVNLAPRYRA